MADSNSVYLFGDGKIFNLNKAGLPSMQTITTY